MAKKIIFNKSDLSQLKKSINEDKPLAELDEYQIGSEGSANDYFHVTNVEENYEFEVAPEDVDLSSFKKEDTLAPRLWDGMDLNPKARLKLLDIADDFWDTVGTDWVERKGIKLTGSICNYNWSKFSDIDLHIVVDFREVDERTDFVQEYYDAKKNEWNNEHENLKIYGYPVEVYVEDISAETESGGVYDLEENAWIKKPNPDDIESIELEKYEIKNKSAAIMTKIDNYLEKLDSSDDEYELRKLGEKSHKLLNKIKAMRKYGLKRGGETDPYNIIYKVLRRTEYLDKLWGISSDLYDKINSIGIDEERNIAEYLCYLIENKDNINFINEEVVADGNADHNIYAKRWKLEREKLKKFIINNGILMTSMENGKTYMTFQLDELAGLTGGLYCLCLEYDPGTMDVGTTIYVRAVDKFTLRMFNASFDTRGKDNIQGTGDDTIA